MADSRLATVRLLCATWNVGNAKPDSDLSPWIPPNGEGFDLIVVGCQECTWGAGRARRGAEAEDDDDPEDGAAIAARPGDTPTGADADDSRARPVGAPTADEILPPGAPASQSAPAPLAPTLPVGLESARSSRGIVTAATEGFSGGGFLSAIANTASFITGQSAAAASCDFFGIVQRHVGAGFALAQSLLLWQTGVMVFVRRSLAPLISNIESGAEATGLLGVAPNKGGCAVALRVGGTSLCFISCHLAAHMKHAEHRNRNVAEILNGIRLGNWDVDIDQQHHHCFFFGDMNYRIDPSLVESSADAVGVDTPDKVAAVSELIRGKCTSKLLAADQLRHFQGRGLVLQGFSEATVAFQPTFKVAREAGFQYKAQRTSSYCDRVLWKSQPALKDDVKCKYYDAYGSLSSSDHKPVSASFDVDCFPAEPDHSKEARAFDPEACPYLQFLNLSASGLMSTDTNGKADPFVCLFTDPANFTRTCSPSTKSLHGTGAAKSDFRTSVKPKTLNPSWKEAEIPRLPLCIHSSSQLSRTHLLLAVMDQDQFKNDRMGSAVLPLAEAARTGVPHTFTIPVVRGGRNAGVLNGQLQIVWPPLRDSATLAGISSVGSERGKAQSTHKAKCCVS